MKIIALLAAVFACAALAAEPGQHTVEPASGYVPDQRTAIRIALAIWEPIYGREQIEKQKPYRATLREGVWVVEGSLPEGWLGGVALAEISQRDGKVLRVSHGK
jgi:hypothetical protein